MAGMIGSAYGGPQNFGDVLSIIGASLRDASPGSSGENIARARGLIQQRQMFQAQQAMMGKIGGMFGSAPEYTDGPAPSVSAPSIADAAAGPQGAPPADVGDLNGALTAAAASTAPAPAPEAPAAYTYQPPTRVSGTGVPASLRDPKTQATLAQMSMFMPEQEKAIADLLDKAQPSGRAVGDYMVDTRTGAIMNRLPHPQYINNFRVDPNDANAPSYIPKLADMTMPDGNGGVRPLPGASDTTGALAGATTNAQEAAKAAYDLVPVPQSDGSTRLMSRSAALGALIGGRGAGGAAGSGAGGGIGDGPQFGVTQTPAEVELAKARASTQGKNETDIAGARSAMQQVDDQTNMIAQNLHDMLGETQDAKTGKWVKTKPSMIGHLSTGSGTDVIEHIPFLNQDAKDLEAKIETVRNGTSFNSLQAIKNAMAAAGDGGSGSIRMTDQTARMLGEINGSLNQDQRGPQFEATVRRHLAQLDALSKARHDLFESQFQGVRPATPGQTGPTATYDRPGAAQSSPRVPQPGVIVKGYKFLGGNPADQKSWARP